MTTEENQPLLKSSKDDFIFEKELNNSSSSNNKSFKNYKNLIITKIKNSMTRETIILLIILVLYIICGVINSILLKKVMNVFSNYGFFLNQLTNYGYIPIFAIFVIIKLIFTNDIPEETRSFPKYKFAIMGGLDALAGFFVIIGGVSTPGPLQQLLNQTIIPFTMVISFFVLKERYKILQIGGALVIFCGVVVSLIPSLTGKAENSGGSLFYEMFYLLSIIPWAFSNVYKTIGFSSVEDMDVWYLQFWSTLFQSIIGTFLFPINNWLPPPSTIKFNEILPSLKNGGECLIGVNSILPQYLNNGTSGPLSPKSCGYNQSSITCDNCHNAWIIILIYMTINIIYNVLILLVLKHGSATLFSIANTLRLPLTNAAFSFHFIMGDENTPFSIYSGIGLIIILAGLGGYRIGSVIQQKNDKTINLSSHPNVIPSAILPNDIIIPTTTNIRKFIQPKSDTHLRNQFFGKLGIILPQSKLNNNNNNNNNSYNKLKSSNYNDDDNKV